MKMKEEDHEVVDMPEKQLCLNPTSQVGHNTKHDLELILLR